jgi:DNA (cytosine-5)-methyltransferase 1
VQEDKSGTLGTGNDQTIFCLQGNGIDRADTAGCNGKGWREDTSYTLNTIDRPAVCAGFKLGNSEQARSIGYAEEQSPTLNAECGGNKPAVMCLNDQGGNVMGVSHDVSGTLRAQEHGHQPAVMAFAQNQREEVRNVGDKAVSLAAEVGMHSQTFVALDMSHACDVIRDCGEVSPSLQARMGTGGNQVPLTYQDVTGTLSPGAHAGSYNGQDAYNDMLVCGANCQQAFAQKRFAEYDSAENAVSIRASGGDYGGGSETLVASQNMVVRRLTPMECERLQGYPDGWTDIGEWMDSKGKRHKDADSPRYKALGNSIALPFWDFLAKRISAQYLRTVTMGSLFDGIGGFPLVFERHNGKGTARWASEIEEFPIAVTKLRFGED